MLHYLDKRHILLFCLMVLFRFSFSQIVEREDKRMWLKADNAFEYGDYLKALNIYKALIKLDSNNTEINYNLGVCYFQLKRYKEEAKNHLDRVGKANYKDLNYYLGNLHHSFREYEQAISRFKAYKNQKGEHTFNNKVIDDLMAKCHTAMLFENSIDKTIQIENLGEEVNTPYAEYAPLISAEEDKLFFTSRRKNKLWTRKDPFGDYYENIFFTEYKNNSWTTPTILDTTINTDYHDACTGLSADGEKILLFRTSKNLRSGNIYESLLKENKWSVPTVLNSNINSIDYAETSACYAPDGNTVFFSSNRPGGFGGKDIYYVRKLPNGEWGEAYNLGEKINTEYDEHAPFIHPSGNILFFSSKGHNNMGGYDILKSTFDESGEFTTPVNLGYPINTVDDDVFFVLNTDGSTGYLSSARKGGYGSHDLYKVNFSESKLPLYVYKVNVYDESNNLLKKVDMQLVDLASNKQYGKYKSNEQSGKMIIISEPNKEYEISIKVDGYKDFVTRSILKKDNHLTFTVTKKEFE